jgi:hypothetical protein
VNILKEFTRTLMGRLTKFVQGSCDIGWRAFRDDLEEISRMLKELPTLIDGHEGTNEVRGLLFERGILLVNPRGQEWNDWAMIELRRRFVPDVSKLTEPLCWRSISKLPGINGKIAAHSLVRLSHRILAKDEVVGMCDLQLGR